MVLYFSSAISNDRFDEAVKHKLIIGGFQAQRFNTLLINGLSKYDEVKVISNPPYTKQKEKYVSKCGNITYFESGMPKYKWCRKINNISTMLKFSLMFGRKKTNVIIVDSINLGAIFVAKIVGRITGIPVTGIITDIPEIMNKEKMDIFSKLDSWLIRSLNGYVLLTEAMNALVNKHDRPFIVMEGLCEFNQTYQETITKSLKNKVCLYSGSLSRSTGIETLVQSFMLPVLSKIELHIYGAGNYAEELKMISLENPNIKYFGVESNTTVINKQKSANLLINPRPSNIYYGAYSFPSKLMEYMASGTPVLTTKLPGIPLEYYDYLHVIIDETPEGFASAITEALNKNEQIGKDAQAFVFAYKNNINQAERVYSFSKSLFSI